MNEGAQEVASWYDSGFRLAGLDGIVKPTAPNDDPVQLLQRYLQLKTVLPNSSPLPDRTVEGLICRVETEVGSKPFDEETIWGDWQLVWQKNAKQATNSQKALAPLPQFSNFMTDASDRKIFRNIVQLTKSRARVIADVAYTAPLADDDYPWRLASTICAAGIELKLGRRFGWRPLRIPLPLRGEGWLDVTFLSPNMRITRGNRGGLFVHLRPALLAKEAAA